MTLWVNSFLATSFKSLLVHTAKDAAVVLREFSTPPESGLWDNPVVAFVSGFKSLSGASCSLESNRLHAAANASKLCDDGCSLVDGGMSKSNRLWLLYDYNSLTDFQGRDRYATFRVLLSAVFAEPDVVWLTLGYCWLSDDTLSRLHFDRNEKWIAENVLDRDHWRVVHELTQRCQ